MRIVATLAALLLAGSALAAELPMEPNAKGAPDTPDPVNSAACQQAVDAMVAAREAASRNPQQQDALVAARRKAARTCLGQSDLAGPAHRPPAAPIRIPPPVLVPPRTLPPNTSLAAPPIPPPPVSQRPSIATACDPAGCWDGQGNRLNRAGSLLIGPHGTCTQQGNLVLCP
ncbi:MAG TPA: hypothetical protein VLJ58_09775 [Ramlibacter sp.]|nr:hypothetical protein [Ramlibacter sp.]